MIRDKQKIRFGVVAILAALLTGLIGPKSAAAVSAAENDKVTLSIYYRETVNHQDVPIEGAEFSLYQVGRLERDGDYQVTEDFKHVKAEKFSDLKTTKDMLEAAKAYAADLAGKQEAQKAVTESNGRLSFPAIPESGFGIYLVMETGKTKSASSYETAEPYLVQLPEPAGDGTWIYKVEAQPKTKKIPDSESNPEKPDSKPESTPESNPGGPESTPERPTNSDQSETESNQDKPGKKTDSHSSKPSESGKTNPGKADSGTTSKSESNRNGVVPGNNHKPGSGNNVYRSKQAANPVTRLAALVKTGDTRWFVIWGLVLIGAATVMVIVTQRKD